MFSFKKSPRRYSSLLKCFRDTEELMKKVKLENEKHFLHQLNISLVLYFFLPPFTITTLACTFTALTPKNRLMLALLLAERSVNTQSVNWQQRSNTKHSQFALIEPNEHISNNNQTDDNGIKRGTTVIHVCDTLSLHNIVWCLLITFLIPFLGRLFPLLTWNSREIFQRCW